MLARSLKTRQKAAKREKNRLNVFGEPGNVFRGPTSVR
jgi:hypothetical protein